MCDWSSDVCSSDLYRVFIDVDPGVTQLSALEYDMGLDDHDAFFTTGLKLGDADCDVPDAGRRWHRFLPFVHLPSWPVAPAPPRNAPYTTVTTWWSDASFPWRGDLLATAKRDAFLPYAEVPRLASRRVTLATHLRPDSDWYQDLAALGDGWDVVDPDVVARTPLRYRQFIARSRGEFSCCKPIYRVLRTGWLSDRTVAYLATGRPAICEETGVGDHLPTGRGLLTFSEPGEAVEALRDIERDYEHHSAAARALAEEHFDARVQLKAIIDRL